MSKPNCDADAHSDALANAYPYTLAVPHGHLDAFAVAFGGQRARLSAPPPQVDFPSLRQGPGFAGVGLESLGSGVWAVLDGAGRYATSTAISSRRPSGPAGNVRCAAFVDNPTNASRHTDAARRGVRRAADWTQGSTQGGRAGPPRSQAGAPLIDPDQGHWLNGAASQRYSPGAQRFLSMRKWARVWLAVLASGAGVAKLADAGLLKSPGPRTMWVRIPPPAPHHRPHHHRGV